MLAVFIPEPTPADEIRKELVEDAVVHNGITYYCDGLGGMYTDLEKCVTKCVENQAANIKAWLDFSETISR